MGIHILSGADYFNERMNLLPCEF